MAESQWQVWVIDRRTLFTYVIYVILLFEQQPVLAIFLRTDRTEYHPIVLNLYPSDSTTGTSVDSITEKARQREQEDLKDEALQRKLA